MASFGQSSSDQSSSRQLYNTVYTRDYLKVQRELIEIINAELLPDLQAIFKTNEWMHQNEPVPRHMIKPLCPWDPQTSQVVCAFCPDSAFLNTDRAIEHIQKDHLGLRPFCCTEPNCGRTFLRNNELTNHVRTHQASQPVPCPKNCGTLFCSNKSGNIQRHLRDSCPFRGSA